MTEKHENPDLNFFTSSVKDIYDYIKNQSRATKLDPDYQVIHEKASQLAFLLLLHAKEKTYAELNLLPIPSNDPESIVERKKRLDPILQEFVNLLNEKQTEAFHIIEEMESGIEWDLRKEAYALGLLNGMVTLAKLMQLVVHQEPSKIS